MRGSNGRKVPENGNEQVDWELRPGGMLVQKRDDGLGGSGSKITIKVSHGSYQHEISVPAQATFGDLKKVITQETGLEPQEQRLLFRGKEKDNEEHLHMVGVKDMSKIMLLEDPASKERKLEQMKIDEGIFKSCEEVVYVRSEVDKLVGEVSMLEKSMHAGTKVDEKEFVILTELLMRHLLKLDSIEAQGEAKVQRRIEVRRVQSLVDTLDHLKARNANQSSNSSKAVSVSTQWETFESGVGSLSAPPPNPMSPSARTQDWEQFE
ncbi:BAG family molecular chaperone regulator 4-like [Aristolochia californica]|uniref:BAG family molecular chaperone regulator 4-like n=1 Tax=Aristolochia californica TaxID=171875 RepID=UPI0035DFF9DD